MLTKGMIAAAKYDAEKPHWKLRDGAGLYLKLTPSGGKLWRMDFRWQGKAQVLSFGAWPAVDIDEARGLRAAAKVALKQGRDPRGPKPLVGDTFGVFADAHIRRQGVLGRSAKTIDGREWLLSATGHARALRPVPIGAITPMDVIGVLRPWEGRETARKLKLALGMVFDSAIVAGAIAVNPCAAIGEQDVRPPQVTHRPAIVDAQDFRGLLAAIACYRGDRLGVVRAALQLLALTALRPGELRLSRWSDIDLVKRSWTIGAERHKIRKKHVIPLSDWAVEILTALHERTGGADWVFPSPRDPDKPISAQACGAALVALGYANRHCPHGFRSAFKSLASEARIGGRQRWSQDAIKLQMSHAIGGAVEQAYHRGAHWAERVELVEWWSREVDHMERVARLIG